MRALFVLLAMMASAVSAHASDCGRWTVDGLLNQVPFFDRRMEPAQGARPGEVQLVHRDDPGISAMFRLQAVAETSAIKRSAYLADLKNRLNLEARDRERRAGVSVETSIFPYDPITWSFVQKTKGSTDVRGVTTIRLSSECHLVGAWSVSQAPSMLSRTQEFQSAVDALRTFTVRQIPKAEFASEHYVPSGFEALAIGAGAPLLGMVLLLAMLQAGAKLVQPGVWPRAAAAVIMGWALWAFQAQLPIYLDNFEKLAYLDGALLLLVVIGASAAAAVVGAHLSVMLSFSAALATGLAFGVYWQLGWAPNEPIAALIAFAFVVLSLFGLIVWQVQAGSHLKKLADRPA